MDRAANQKAPRGGNDQPLRRGTLMVHLRVWRTRRMPRHSEGVKRPKNLSDGGRKLYGTEVLVRNVSAEFGEILLPTAVGIRMTLQLRR